MRMISGAYEYNTPHVVAENFQEGLIVLNLETGKYFEIGERLVPLLDALLAGTRVEALKDGVSAIEADAGNAIDVAIDFMLEQQLLRAAPVTAEGVDASVCADIMAAGTGFHIEAHDDLAELMAADPIHDIDPETGRITQ